MDQEERAELVTRIFARITSKLEDAAADAMEGQSKEANEREQIARAERIETSARDIQLMAEAAAAILRQACQSARKRGSDSNSVQI
ncbi:hypothetical protein [Sphingomonas sp. SRS2]|uniref:hypothetical protein n=1 Tax=Sphingomonas sp. SRS2 TaxID=133190 RepID=UPI000A063902|nr:hypothetical protein [Sphingomonas sp. SRS2]